MPIPAEELYLLSRRLSIAPKPSFELDRELWRVQYPEQPRWWWGRPVSWPPDREETWWWGDPSFDGEWDRRGPDYTRSVEVAQELLGPKWNWLLGWKDDRAVALVFETEKAARGATPALALCSAAILSRTGP